MGEHLKTVLLFLAFSAVIAFIGWMLGAYDYDPREGGYTETLYHPPAGERRF